MWHVTAPRQALRAFTPSRGNLGTYLVAVLILIFAFYIISPIILVIIHSFNVAGIAEPAQYSLQNWRVAFSDTSVILSSLGNTILLWSITTLIGFPIAILIAWILARTRIPFSNSLEFMFWVAVMVPNISVTIGWIYLLHPRLGMVNRFLTTLPFVEQGPFNIFSIPGMVWVGLMSGSIGLKVMLLTPAFRNMNSALEEAARVSGASNLRTVLRVMLPVMIAPLTVVFALNLVRIFNAFETELILGAPINFWVYSTRIFQLVRWEDPPQYGQATALASLTMLVIAFIIPLQRWIMGRRQYTTISGQFRPGLIDIGPWQIVANIFVIGVLLLLTVVPVVTLIGGSFMTRVGFFEAKPLFTTYHWSEVIGNRFFIQALKNTFLLSMTTAIVSPILFSMIAYIIVRTKFRGRGFLDGLFWFSAAIPGILSGLGLLWMVTKTPGLIHLFGTIWILIIVVILQGKLSATKLFQGAFVQIGVDMEEAARLSGAGWIRTYIRIWLPLLMPTLILVGTLNFVIAAGTTSSIILLASRGTTTLSILALQMSVAGQTTLWEQAGIVSLFILAMTLGVALVARTAGLRLGIQHERLERGERPQKALYSGRTEKEM